MPKRLIELEDIPENQPEIVEQPKIVNKKQFKEVLVLDPTTGKVQQAMKPKRKPRERNPETIEKQKKALEKARQKKIEYAKQREADKSQALLKLRAQQKQDRAELSKQYKRQGLEAIPEEPKTVVPETPMQPDEPIDIRGMIRDVVRSEMLEHIPRVPLVKPSLPIRRAHKKSYAPLSTDTEADMIEVRPVKPKKTHKIKAPPPQVPVVNSKVELPVPLLKKPEYNPMTDIFGLSQ